MKKTPFTTISDFYLPVFGVEELEALLDILRKFPGSQFRFTPRNQLAVAGIDDIDLPALKKQLQTCMIPLERSEVTVLTCQGCGKCTIKSEDIEPVAHQIKEIARADKLPAKIKIAVAGCTRCCTMPYVRDLGLIPSAKGWKLIFGGNGGGTPRIGTVVAEQLATHEMISLISRCLRLYRQYAEMGQRTSRFIEAFGEAQFKQKLLKSS